jgi:hypothetical protein
MNRNARKTFAVAALIAISSSACVREKQVRIESGQPGPWREQRLVRAGETPDNVSVTLRQTDSALEASVVRHESCYAIDVREVPRTRVSESVTAIGTYFVAAALGVTGAVVVLTAERGKEGVVPAGLGVIFAGVGVLAPAELAKGTSRSVLPADREHRVRPRVSCDRQARGIRIELRSGELARRAETDDSGHASFAGWPTGPSEPTQVFIEGVLVTDVRFIKKPQIGENEQ